LTFENKKIILTGLLVVLLGLTGANSYINLDEGFYFEGSEIQDENRDTVASYSSIDDEWRFPVNISVEGNAITGVSESEDSDSVVPQSQVQSNYLNREGGDSMDSFLDMNDNRVLNLAEPENVGDAVTLGLHNELETDLEQNVTELEDSIEDSESSATQDLGEVLAEGDLAGTDIDMGDNAVVGLSDLEGSSIVDSSNIGSDSVGSDELDQDSIDCSGSYC